MISRVLVLRVLGWSLFYSVVTAIPPTILFTILAVLYSISRDLADAFTPFMFLTVVVLLLIGIVSLLPLAKYAYLRYYAFNPELARELMKESDQKNPETKALGLLILLSGLAVIVPINPLNIIATILMIRQRSILMLPLTNIIEIGFFAWVYVKWFRKYVRDRSDRGLCGRRRHFASK